MSRATSRFKVPHTLALLFGLMVLAQVATYVLPQGRYETRVDDHGKAVVLPGTYQVDVEREYLAPWHVLAAVPRAFAEAQDIIFFVFIIGGALAVIRATGAIDAFIGRLIQRFGRKPAWLVLGGLLVFSLGSSALGMAEEYIPFVAVVLLLCRAMRLDAITAIAIIVVGYGIGYGVAAINPFTVVVAQGIAGLQPTSGLGFRLLLFLPFLLLGAVHVLRYAKAVRLDPGSSLLEGFQVESVEGREPPPPLLARHLLILALLVGAIGLIVYGVSSQSGWHWYLTELGAVFLGLTLLAALIGGLSPDCTAAEFCKGAAELTTTALLIGFARSIALILEDGQVIHTIVHALATPLRTVGPGIAAVGMFVIQSVLNFVIPSGSGQAYVTMPIMAPIADVVGVSRQVAVLAYQFGDGFTNMVVPTNAVLMGILGLGGVPYARWLRFIWPLLLQLWALGALALIAAVHLGYR